MGSTKLSIWTYVVLWFVLSLVFAFPFLPSRSEWLDMAASTLAMCISFVLVYVIANRIEHGASHLSEGVRFVAGVLVMIFGSSVMGLPVALIWAFVEGQFIEAVIAVSVGYVGVVVMVIFLLTILSWINDTSPRKEFENSLRMVT